MIFTFPDASTSDREALVLADALREANPGDARSRAESIVVARIVVDHEIVVHVGLGLALERQSGFLRLSSRSLTSHERPLSVAEK
ncbi:hypothetical protein [Sorangium cellulosum]|uniref:hypothetical protein n=1 Tax=Sorangium cellulosum TaxID=56 RepID=UPI001A927D60|nr:hypothetical protein [Sorangium cellulosum]